MKTLIFIHGGDSYIDESQYLDFLKNDYISFYTKPWEDTAKSDYRTPIAKKWKENGGIVWYPTMPNKQNAQYREWKIVFEEILGKIENGDHITLIGGSLGGCFLLKYFSDIAKSDEIVSTQMKQKISLFNIDAVHLLAACISEGDFTTPENYNYLNSLGNKVHIWHSEDDPIVGFDIAKELGKKLPQATTHFFPSTKGYGHFFALEQFPELEATIFQK